MTGQMARMTIEEALDYCLANPDNLSAQELLAMFPQYRAELEPLLALSTAIRQSGPPPVPSERRAAMKQRLMNAAGTVPAPVPPSPDGPAPLSAGGLAQRQRQAAGRAVRRPWPPLPAMRPAWAGMVLAAAMALLLWWGTANALPGSPLYPVKLGSEDLTVVFAPDPVGQARRHIALADERLGEIELMAGRGALTQAGPAFASYNSHLSAASAIWQRLPDPERRQLAPLLLAAVQGGQDILHAYEVGEGSQPAAIQALLRQTLSNLASIERDLRASMQGGTPTPSASPAATRTSAVVAATGTATGRPAPGLPPTHTITSILPPSPATTNTRAAGGGGTPPPPTRTPPARVPTVTPRRGPPTQVPPPPAQTAKAAITRTPPGLVRTPAATPPHPTPVPPTRPPVPLLCDLKVSSVDVSCDPQGCVLWTASVTNPGSGPVAANWVAELLVNARGGFEVVATAQGSASFLPGTSTVSGNFCYAFPPEANNFKVNFRLEAGDAVCRPEGTSPASAPCGDGRGPPGGGGPDRTPGPPATPPGHDQDRDKGKPPRM
jgi:hypothetical protein